MIIPSPITGKIPKISKSAFIAPTATIIGDVTIHPHANIWFGAVLRGDVGTLIVGENTSIQEHVAMHTTQVGPCHIKENCIVGHHAMVHGPSIVEDHCMVGINAVVLQDSHIGRGTIIASGAVARKKIPAFRLIAGVPAVVKRELSEDRIVPAREAAMHYREYAQAFIDKGLNHPDLESYYF